MLKYVGNCSFQIHFSRRSLDLRIQANFLKNIAIRHPLTMSKLIHFQVELSRYYFQARRLVSFFIYFFNIYLNDFLISNISSHYVCSKTLRVILKTVEFHLLFSTDQGAKSNVIIRPTSVKIGAG